MTKLVCHLKKQTISESEKKRFIAKHIDLKERVQSKRDHGDILHGFELALAMLGYEFVDDEDETI